MTWRDYEVIQKDICAKYGAEWLATPPDQLVAIATNLDLNPIHGLRILTQDNLSGWFIWSGDYSEATDFYEPVCAAHLVDVFPKVIEYMGLTEGWRFLIDRNGYEDVWFDESCLKAY